MSEFESLSIRIVDSDGSALPEATAWWQVPTGRFESASARNGTVDVGPISTSFLQCVWIDAEGFARRRLEFVCPIPGSRVEVGPIALARGPRVRATLRTPDGSPLRRATASIHQTYSVMVHSGQWNGPDLDVEIRGTALTSPPLAPGEVTLVVEVDGFAELRRHVSVAADYDGDIELGIITLETGRTLTGNVREPDGKGVSGATIHVMRIHGSTVNTGDDGAFEIAGLGTSEERIEIRADGFVHSQASIAPDQESLNITLERTLELRGVAVDANSGDPVAIDDVQLCRIIRRGDLDPWTVCGSSNWKQGGIGRFRVRANGTGEYSLEIKAAGFETHEVTLPDVAAAAAEPLRIELERAGSPETPPLISGILRADSEPVVGALVVARAKARREMDALNGRIHRGIPIPTGGLPIAQAVTDGQGQFVVEMPEAVPEHVRSSTLFVHVYEPNGRTTLLGPFVGNGGTLKEELTLDVPRATIQGEVSDMPQSAADRCFAVAFNRSCYLGEAPVSADGRFTFTDLPAGEYLVRIGTGIVNRAEVARLDNPDDRNREANPWLGAEPISIGPAEVKSVVVPYPQSDGKPE